jgi:cytochrome c oxidase cbb3-type subunit 3
MLRLTLTRRGAYKLFGVAAAIVGMHLIPSCKREERVFRVQPPAANTSDLVAVTGFHAGATSRPASVPNEYEENAYAVSEGKRLFDAMNCSGCHFHGGGGIGPALMDDRWIYGSDPEQIFATIVQGRPNGMPSFRGKLPDYQVWQLAAYVRALGSLTSTQPRPGRSDHMQVRKPENALPPNTPAQGGVVPPSALAPG